MKKLSRAGQLVGYVLCLFALLALAGALHALALVTPRAAPGQFGIAGSSYIDLPPFQNVVATGKATSALDNVIGRTVDQIVLILGGGSLTKAMLSNIRLLANERVIWEDSGSRADDRNEYRGLASNAAYLSIPFTEVLAAHNNADKYAGSIDTLASGIRKLTLEVDISGATTPTLKAKALVRNSPQSIDPNYNALIAKVMNRTWNPGAAGEFSFPLNYQISPLTMVKRVHFHGSTVTDVRLKVTEVVAAGKGVQNVTEEIFKAADADNDFIQTEIKRVPQANVFTVDFMLDGDVRRALSIGNVRAMEWLVTVSGAGNVVAVSELLDPLNNN